MGTYGVRALLFASWGGRGGGGGGGGGEESNLHRREPTCEAAAKKGINKTSDGQRSGVGRIDDVRDHPWTKEWQTKLDATWSVL